MTYWEMPFPRSFEHLREMQDRLLEDEAPKTDRRIEQRASEPPAEVAPVPTPAADKPKYSPWAWPFQP